VKNICNPYFRNHTNCLRRVIVSGDTLFEELAISVCLCAGVVWGGKLIAFGTSVHIKHPNVSA
jgi:hypothetical protein